jgi:hypothetical protein
METEHEDALERRRDELRRIVYGTPGGAEADAAVELAEVEAELAARSAAAVEPEALEQPEPEPATWRDAASRATGPEAASPATEPDAATPATEEPPERWRPTRGQVVAAVLALILIVAAGVALIGPARDALSPPRGLGVFERELLPDDLDRVDQVATGAGLGPDEAMTLRTLGRAFGYEFWVFRDDNRVCLLSQRLFFFDWMQTCATLQEFQAHGLTRRIAADEIRDGARPRRIGPGDVVVVTWGPESTEIEWRVEP